MVDVHCQYNQLLFIADVSTVEVWKCVTGHDLPSRGRGLESTMLTVAEERNKDRHKKKPLQLRLHQLIRQQLEALAERNASNLTAEVTIAIRERLERAGLWPPPAEVTIIKATRKRAGD